jgi:dsRNA-specific ribonuclease
MSKTGSPSQGHGKEPTDISYILNENNKLITPEYIITLLKTYGINIKVNNLNIFQEAMIHLSYLIRNEDFYKNNKTKVYQIQSNDIDPLDSTLYALPLQNKSYERLEFLGDAIIHSILAEYLFKRYQGANEGFMTK